MLAMVGGVWLTTVIPKTTMKTKFNLSTKNSGANHGTTAAVIRQAHALCTEADKAEFTALVKAKIESKESDLAVAWKIFNRTNSRKEANRIRAIEIEIGTFNRALKSIA